MAKFNGFMRKVKETNAKDIQRRKEVRPNTKPKRKLGQ